MKRRVVSVVRVSVCERVCASERARTCLFVCKCVRRGKLRTTLWSNTTIIDFKSINLFIFPPSRPLRICVPGRAHIVRQFSSWIREGKERKGKQRHLHGPSSNDGHNGTVQKTSDFPTLSIKCSYAVLNWICVNLQPYSYDKCLHPHDHTMDLYLYIMSFIYRIVSYCHSNSLSLPHTLSRSLDLIRLQWHWIW